MTDNREDIETRRRRLLWRATHRGTREMDLVLGGFARTHLASLSVAELDDFERILGLEDPEITAWVVARNPVPAQYQSPILTRILAFQPEVY
jgi:antitoxin CptB